MSFSGILSPLGQSARNLLKFLHTTVSYLHIHISRRAEMYQHTPTCTGPVLTGQQDFSHLRRLEEKKHEREEFSCQPAKESQAVASSIFSNKSWLMYEHAHQHTPTRRPVIKTLRSAVRFHAFTRLCCQSGLKWVVLISRGIRSVSICIRLGRRAQQRGGAFEVAETSGRPI